MAAAGAWFTGVNDARQLMWDPETGGGFDGLRADGVNRNQGAESTLAVLSTMQHAQRFRLCGNDFRAARSSSRAAPSASRPTRRGSSPDSSCQARRGSSTRSPERQRCWRGSWPWTKDRCGRRWMMLSIRFDGRHRDLADTFRRHADELADRLDPGVELSEARKLLLGAAFTSEYAIEGAALCNPSIVAHPDQAGIAAGSLRFVMSVRGIGEGHCSSIGFRTGVIDAAGRASDRRSRLPSPQSGRRSLLCSTQLFSAVNSPGSSTRGRSPTTYLTGSARASPELLSINNSPSSRLT